MGRQGGKERTVKGAPDLKGWVGEGTKGGQLKGLQILKGGQARGQREDSERDHSPVSERGFKNFKMAFLSLLMIRYEVYMTRIITFYYGRISTHLFFLLLFVYIFNE